VRRRLGYGGNGGAGGAKAASPSLFQSIFSPDLPLQPASCAQAVSVCAGSPEIRPFYLEQQVANRNGCNNERVKTIKSMGSVEQFPAFSDEDIRNACNTSLTMMMMITWRWLYSVMDVPFPCSDLLFGAVNITVPRGTRLLFVSLVLIFSFWPREDWRLWCVGQFCIWFLFNKLQIRGDANLTPVRRFTSCRLEEVKEKPFRNDWKCSAHRLAAVLYVYL